MAQWEYEKIDLGQTVSRQTDLDLLEEAGRAGWELVAITPNGVAYLKRPAAARTSQPKASSAARR